MIQRTIQISSAILVLAFNSLVLGSSIEDGWKGIKPLKTDRKTAEKVLGMPEKVTKFGYFNYRTAEFFVHMNYSTAACQESEYNRGKYNVPDGTVLSYSVILTKGIKLNDFKFKREKYTKEIDSEAFGSAYYTNGEDSVMLGVYTVNGVEYVGRIWFSPSLADTKKFECKKSESAIDNSIEDGWKGIKPFRTDKATVEKLLDSAKKAIKTGLYQL